MTDAVFIKTILAAVDASDRAPKVFDTAAALAAKFGAKLHLIRVISIHRSYVTAMNSKVTLISTIQYR